MYSKEDHIIVPIHVMNETGHEDMIEGTATELGVAREDNEKEQLQRLQRKVSKETTDGLQ